MSSETCGERGGILAQFRSTGMSVEKVKEVIRGLIASVCGIAPSTISDGATIDEDLQLSSVSLIELQVALEEAFDLELDPLEILELNELGRISEAILRKLRAASEG